MNGPSVHQKLWNLAIWFIIQYQKKCIFSFCEKKILSVCMVILFYIHFPLQSLWGVFLMDFLKFKWTLYLFFQFFNGVGFNLNGICFFVLNYKCNRIENHIFCLFNRSPLSRLLRFSMEVVTHLINEFKWFWMDLKNSSRPLRFTIFYWKLLQ
jgi:hypothetical protein